MPVYRAENLDNDDFSLPARPERRRSPWLIPGLLLIGFVLFTAIVMAGFVFSARQAADREQAAAMRARTEAAYAEQEAIAAVERGVLDERAGRGGLRVEALAQAYAADEVSAAARYTGMRIRLVGVMHQREVLADGSSAVSFADEQGRPVAARAFFPAAEAEKLVAFDRGVPVSFHSTGGGWERNGAPAFVAIRDCRVVSVPKFEGPRKDR